MSDNIPIGIQEQIMKRLPVKSLIQFRSVCKAWKSLIDSPRFIAGYSSQQSESQHILVRYDRRPGFLQKYISIADDVSFPQHKVSLTPPPFVKLFLSHEELGISRGLFCLYSRYHDGYGTGLAVLWNVAIRKSVAVVVPNMIDNYEFGNVLGFGVCSRTNDPKIVKITFIQCENTESISSIPWQVEVFTLSTRAWRRPYGSNLPRKSICFFDSQVDVDGVVYWLATEEITMAGGSSYYNLIVSFDLTSEEFGELNVPDCLACQDIDDNPNPNLSKLSMRKLRESLVVLERIEEANNTVYVVWMMGDGFPKSFTKLLTINLGTLEYASVLGFRKSGEPLIKIPKDDREIFKLAVYEPYTKQIDRLGIDTAQPFSVHSSMETLLLHDQPNHTLYYNSWNDLPFADSMLHEVNIQLVNV